MNKINWGRLLLAIGVCEGAGLVGSVFTSLSVRNWYVALNKPAFTPPSWVFGPAWTTLFLLMGVALYLVWRAKESQKKAVALKIFWVQLGLNVAWSLLFFGLRSILLALLEIAILWLVIAMTIKKFRRVSFAAGWLLVPYLAWVSFAAVLNLSIVILN